MRASSVVRYVGLAEFGFNDPAGTMPPVIVNVVCAERLGMRRHVPSPPRAESGAPRGQQAEALRSDHSSVIGPSMPCVLFRFSKCSSMTD